jgi:hypothetical protein
VNPPTVDLQNGNLQIVNPIGPAPSTGPTSPPLQVDPVLVYNSDTADPRPIFSVTWQSNVSDGLKKKRGREPFSPDARGFAW